MFSFCYQWITIFLHCIPPVTTIFLHCIPPCNRGRIYVYRCMSYCNGEILHDVLSFSIVRSIVIITILHRIKFCHLPYVFTAITCITMLTCMLYFNLYLIVYFNFNKNNMYAKIFNIHVTLV